MKTPHLESVEEKVEEIAELIGTGIHYGLRKWCESSHANDAWEAISAMPNDEWNGVINSVAEELSKRITTDRANIAQVIVGRLEKWRDEEGDEDADKIMNHAITIVQETLGVSSNRKTV